MMNCCCIKSNHLSDNCCQHFRLSSWKAKSYSEVKRNKAVYTAALVADEWAGAENLEK